MEIRLPANFSTGYRWVLDPPLQAARVLSENYQGSSFSPNVGTAGIQVFRVVFPRDGKFNLKFSYRRLWEPSSVPPAQVTNLVVRVFRQKTSVRLWKSFSRGTTRQIPVFRNRKKKARREIPEGLN